MDLRLKKRGRIMLLVVL